MAVDGCSVKASNYRYPTSVLAVISLVVEVLLLEKVTGALFEAKHSDACAPFPPLHSAHVPTWSIAQMLQPGQMYFRCPPAAPIWCLTRPWESCQGCTARLDLFCIRYTKDSIVLDATPRRRGVICLVSRSFKMSG